MDNDDFVFVERHDSGLEQDDDSVPSVTPEDLEKIRLWLSPTEFESEGSEYRKHLNAHVQGTGDWLFQTSQYRCWHNDQAGPLWIQGIPGSGKSVVAANLIQTLKKEKVPVLFFFSRRIIKSNSEPRHLGRDCLFQFLDHSLALKVRLKKIIEQNPNIENVPFHELWRALLSALSTAPKVYFLFDALDELAVEEDGFLQCLLELGQLKPNSIKLMMTSRPLPHLQAVLKGSSQVIIRLTGRTVEKDIATYITHRMANQQEKILTTEDQLTVRGVLCQKAKGLFLYARLMLDEILRQSTPECISLDHLPSSLEDMYVNLLHEHSSRSGASLHFQSLLLSWITHACRPLRVTELAVLINSQDDRCGLNDSQDAKLTVCTSCGPLLEILDDETVQVIHHSFTEFLLDSGRSSAEQGTGSEKWFPAFTPALVHQSLTLSCVNYLLSGCLESWSVDERPTKFYSRKSEEQRHLMVRFQFLQYASRSLLYHAAKCDTLDVGLVSKFDRLFQYGSHEFESFKDFLFSQKTEPTPNGFYALHISAQAGLVAYTLHLLRKGENPDFVDSHGRTATNYAAIHGNAQTLAALLSQGASFTINDCNGLVPIHYAAIGNHVKVLQYLLDAGADPMSPKSDEENSCHSWRISTIGKTPIQYACELGNEETVSELLQKLGSHSKSTILPHWASARGQAKVLSILFQHPEILANINKKDVCGNTALYLAAYFSDSATVRILLHHGADVYSRSDDLTNSIGKPADSKAPKSELGRTPLQGWANCRRRRVADVRHGSAEEWEKAGKLLIEAGCDIEARNEAGKTVLFAWSSHFDYGHESSDRLERFVALLLKHGANPRATDNAGNTPLHQYPGGGINARIIGFFVKSGADINHTRNDDLVTPLIAAAKSGIPNARAYVDNGADPNMQDSDGNTALHHVCRSSTLEISYVQEWLTFARPTIKNKKGETCLYKLNSKSRSHSSVEAIQLLVEKGLDLESRNRLGRTALLDACQYRRLNFIIDLVRCGANVTSRDFQNKSCLHMFMKALMFDSDHDSEFIQRKSHVMKSLIQAGADINSVDFDGNTSFHDAVESMSHFTHFKIMLELILGFGGVANISDHCGRTALHKVASLSVLDSRDYFRRRVPDRIDFLLQQCLRLDLHAQDNQGMMAIHYAALTSEYSTWIFVQAGGDLQAKADDGRNPLHFAAGAAQSNAVGLLCRLYRERSWTVDQMDEIGRTALHYAACSGNSESVYYLLQSGANPNVKDNQGRTPLQMAAEHQNNSIRLRKHRKDDKKPYQNDIPAGMSRLAPFMDKRVKSPLHEVQWELSLAIGQEEEAHIIQDIVRLLLSAGADPSLHDKSMQTAYDAAFFLNNQEMADVLSNPKQKSDAQSSIVDQWYSFRGKSAVEIVQNVNIESADAYALFQNAIFLRNEVVLDALLKTGIDITALGPVALTPVHIIAYWGLISMMKIVASSVKNLNVFSPPLLHVAASREQSNIQMIELLIELGVNVNAVYQSVDDEKRSFSGAQVPPYTAAHVLALGDQWWNILALERLCEAGADLELTNGDGNTVLQCVLNERKSESWESGFWRDATLELLLRRGANINALSPETGLTPLTTALKSQRDHKFVQDLIDRGADITLGKVPALFAAIESGNPEATAAVLNAGADVNAIYYRERPQWDSGPKLVTPLLSAAINDGCAIMARASRTAREAIVSLLLQGGSNPLMELQDGETTVLHEIAFHHGLVIPILKAGVDLEIRDSQGRTPLLLACSPHQSYRATHDESTPRELILAGANTSIIDSAGSTLLHLAVQFSLFETVTLLLEKDASTSASNNEGLSPLYYALTLVNFTSKLKLTKALLSADAEPLFIGPNGETALHLLAPSLMRLSPGDGAEAQDRVDEYKDKTDYLKEFKGLYQIFIDRGCKRNGRDHLGNTPLFSYVKKVKDRNMSACVEPPAEEDVREMFDDCDVLAVNDEGDTLLHAVAGRKEEGGSDPDGVWLFKELMLREVDPKQENKRGVSALDVAAACGNQAILGLFAREE